MNVELNETQARLLRTQLALRIEELEKEAAHSDRREFQHALALDVDALKEVLSRVDAGIAAQPANKRLNHGS